jgi:hypothetical protein
MSVSSTTRRTLVARILAGVRLAAVAGKVDEA